MPPARRRFKLRSEGLFYLKYGNEKGGFCFFPPARFGAEPKEGLGEIISPGRAPKKRLNR